MTDSLHFIAASFAGVFLLAAVLWWFRRQRRMQPHRQVAFHPSMPAAPSRIVLSAAARQSRVTQLLLQGNLSQTPLHDLLQYLSLCKKTGVLELTSGRRAGQVHFREGVVKRAGYRGKQGLQALHMLLDLKAGDFDFQEGKPEDAPEGQELEVIDAIMGWMANTESRRI